MNKKYQFVGNLNVARKVVALSAGIVITLFSCTEDVQASSTFVRSDAQMELTKEIVPTISANLEIALAPNIEKSTVVKEPVSIEGGMGNALEDFVSSILTNTKPLDSDISKFVDENFWDLI